MEKYIGLADNIKLIKILNLYSDCLLPDQNHNRKFTVDIFLML